MMDSPNLLINPKEMTGVDDLITGKAKIGGTPGTSRKMFNLSKDF